MKNISYIVLLFALFLFVGCEQKPADTQEKVAPKVEEKVTEQPLPETKTEQPEATSEPVKESLAELAACRQLAKAGFRPIADSREKRFLGKVADFTAACRGGNILDT